MSPSAEDEAYRLRIAACAHPAVALNAGDAGNDQPILRDHGKVRPQGSAFSGEMNATISCH